MVSATSARVSVADLPDNTGAVTRLMSERVAVWESITNSIPVSSAMSERVLEVDLPDRVGAVIKLMSERVLVVDLPEINIFDCQFGIIGGAVNQAYATGGEEQGGYEYGPVEIRQQPAIKHSPPLFSLSLSPASIGNI